MLTLIAATIDAIYSRSLAIRVAACLYDGYRANRAEIQSGGDGMSTVVAEFIREAFKILGDYTDPGFFEISFATSVRPK